MFVCYICQLSHGGNHGGARIDNTPKRYLKGKTMFKNGGETTQKLFSWMTENNSFESKELPEPESLDVIPIYSGYESPLSLSLTISSLCFFLYLSLLFLPVHFVISKRILTKTTRINQTECILTIPLPASFICTGEESATCSSSLLLEGAAFRDCGVCGMKTSRLQVNSRVGLLFKGIV